MPRPRRLPRILLNAATLALHIGCAGCLHGPRDITQTPAVQQLGLVGLCLTLTKEVPLVEVGKPYRRLALDRPSERATGGPGRLVATVPAGTRLHIVKVERAVTYWDGLYSIDGNLAFGRIDSGEHVGKVVDLGWGWIGVLPEASRVREPFTPCPETPDATTPTTAPLLPPRPACGYDLRATPERCPECGAAP